MMALVERIRLRYFGSSNLQFSRLPPFGNARDAGRRANIVAKDYLDHRLLGISSTRPFPAVGVLAGLGAATQGGVEAPAWAHGCLFEAFVDRASGWFRTNARHDEARTAGGHRRRLVGIVVHQRRRARLQRLHPAVRFDPLCGIGGYRRCARRLRALSRHADDGISGGVDVQSYALQVLLRPRIPCHARDHAAQRGDDRLPLHLGEGLDH